MKKNLKSLVASMLAFTLVLSACGTSKPAQKDADKPADGKLKGEITVQAEKGWMEYYKKAVDKITKANPDAKITLKETGAFEHLEVITKTDATNKDVADVFAIPADKFTELADNNVLGAIPAAEMAKELGGFDDFDNGLGGQFKKDKDYLAFPFNIESLVTFVNTKNAEALKIDHTKPFEMTAQKDAATVLLPFFDAWFGVAPNNAGGLDLLAKNEGKFASTYANPYDKLNADQKAVFDGIYGYWKLNKDAGTPLFDTEAGWGYIDKEFTTGGKGVIRLDGPWSTAGDGVIAKEIKAGNVEVYPINHITVAGKPFAHWKGGWALAINSRIEENKDKVALATAVIKEVVNPANAIDLYKSTGKILGNVKADVYKASDLSEIDKKVVTNVIESYNVSPARPLFKEYGQVWDTWKNAVLSWNSVKPADPAAAYKELNAAFTSMLEQLK
ncbi:MULTISPECIES: sugar ABC transporter substrate-binding protein [Helcococcus]|uniref:Sugar ABC transporter substrate-binding protein n=1 Tax=Helcococcus bovis TaxID=3153252 RepID=A0ABW9F5P9_9FIRM